MRALIVGQLLALLFAFSFQRAHAEVLYGVTAPDVLGNASLVTVNVATGAATPLFSFVLSPAFDNPSALSLAWDAPAGKFVCANPNTITGGSIAVIDPVTHA